MNIVFNNKQYLQSGSAYTHTRPDTNFVVSSEERNSWTIINRFINHPNIT